MGPIPVVVGAGVAVSAGVVVGASVSVGVGVDVLGKLPYVVVGTGRVVAATTTQAVLSA